MAITKVTIKRDLEKEKKNQKKYKKHIFLMAGIIAISVLLFVGTTYAIFRATTTGAKEQIIVAGIFSIDFNEGSKVELDNTLPLSDEKGMKTSPYTFTIENTGEINAMYRIKLEEDTTNPSNMLSRSEVKISYKKNDGDYTTPQLLSNLSNELILITDQSLNTDGKDSYEIKMWVDENVSNNAQGKQYKTKIVVEAVQSNIGSFSDTIPPVIKLSGENNQNISQGSPYIELGALSITDDVDGSLDTSLVSVTYEYYDGSTTTTVNGVDTSKVGVYYIYYKISDSNKNEGLAVRTINVNKVDKTPPVLTLVGEENIQLNVGSLYVEPGFSATDDTDGILTDKVVIIGNVNTALPGNYVIKYIIIDSEGNINSTTRTVTIVANES